MLHNLFFMEQHFLLWLQDSVRNPMLTKIFVFITSLGNGGAFWILLSLGLMIPKKTRKAGTLSLLSLACCAIVTNVCLKNLVARTRPYDVIEGLTSLVGIQKDFSFPSGVHYPSDVLGGLLVGSLTGLVVYWAGTRRAKG